jgi:uncharacterized protein YggU (UPF0235/DUF167 family)
MARPKAPIPPAAEVSALATSDGKLAVRVTPGARREALEIVDGRLLAKVRAKPQDGKANLAVLVLVASALGLAPSKLEVLRGATSREKLLRIWD